MRGGGEFSWWNSFWVKIKYKFWDLFTATYEGKVAFNLNPELGE